MFLYEYLFIKFSLLYDKYSVKTRDWLFDTLTLEGYLQFQKQVGREALFL